MTNTSDITNKGMLTVATTVDAAIEKVWDYFTMPAHIKRWNYASEDWQTINASSDLKEGGNFSYRMEAKDGSVGFDFFGIFDVITPNEYIEYTLGDGRKVSVKFTVDNAKTHVREDFEAETTNAADVQKMGWQTILDNFKRYTETH